MCGLTSNKMMKSVGVEKSLSERVKDIEMRGEKES